MMAARCIIRSASQQQVAPGDASANRPAPQAVTGHVPVETSPLKLAWHLVAGVMCSSGFVKRDGRPKTSETLVSRLVDRSLRPAFAPGWTYDTQVPSDSLQGGSYSCTSGLRMPRCLPAAGLPSSHWIPECLPCIPSVTGPAMGHVLRQRKRNRGARHHSRQCSAGSLRCGGRSWLQITKCLAHYITCTRPGLVCGVLGA